MAKKFKGEYTLVGSDGTEYPLKFGFNAVCAIEEEFDKPIQEAMDSLNDPKQRRMKMLRSMLKASMAGSPSDESVGDLIDDVGYDELTKAFTAMLGGATKEEAALPLEQGALTGVLN